MTTIADQLRKLADELDGGGQPNAEGGHTLADSDPGNGPEFVDGICVADYWVRNRIGCMKGARQSDYSICFTLTGYLMGEVPRHLVTVADPSLGPPGASGMQLLASVADAGWVNGRDYKPENPPGKNEAAWNAAGRPSANQYGKYSNTGDFAIGGSFSPGTPA